MSASRRGLAGIDRLLLATLVPAWVFCLGLSFVEGVRTGFPYIPPLFVRSAASAEAHPTLWDRVPALGLEAGDRLVTVDGTDVRGMSRYGLMAPGYRARLERRPAHEFELERAGRRWMVQVPLRRDPFWWNSLPFGIAVGATFTLLLLRRPDWHLARRGFVVGIAQAVVQQGYDGPIGIPLNAAFSAAVGPVSQALLLSILLDLPRPRPWPRWVRAAPWAIALVIAARNCTVLWGSLGIDAASWRAFSVTVNVLPLAAMGLALADGYRRSEAFERRQLRWVVYGFALALAAVSARNVLQPLGVSLPPAAQDAVYVGAALGLVCVPLGFLIAVLRADFLDIDRLISSTTSAALLGAIAVAGALAVIPRAARAAGGALGIPPETAQWLLAAVLVPPVIAAYRALRPRLDGLLFAAHQDLEQGMTRLGDELARTRDVGELVELAGERLAALLRPESLVIYSREGDALAPLFVQGAAAPPAYPATSPLIAALQARGAPLVARRWSERRASPAEPFDRAALDALGAAVVLPVRRGELLAAFLCLGPKRSGDVYTPTELALLAAVATRASERLAGFAGDALVHEARELQDALRRYVPGAVAARLSRGEELEAGEREVTVLFVDLRGYTGMAQGMSAPEIFSTVNRYTERVSALVAEHGGAVVEFHGDGLLAVFGAPDPLPAKERAAVAAARRIVEAIESLGEREGGPALSVGVGVATGPAFVGNVRSHDREIWSVLGNTTNLAARLQALTRELDARIAIDDPTRRAASDVCREFVLRPAVAIRGRSEPVDVHVLGAGAPRI